MSVFGFFRGHPLICITNCADGGIGGMLEADVDAQYVQ